MIQTILTSTLISAAMIPLLIKLGLAKGFYALGGENRKETRKVPVLGGVAIYFGLVLSTIITAETQAFSIIKVLIPSLTLLFICGWLDDAVDISAKKKLIVQLTAISIAIYGLNLRIDIFHGFIGSDTINAMITIGACTFIINAYNLIDGLDGLAGTIGAIVALCFGIYLWTEGALFYASLSFALAGSLTAFLVFNFAPAKIFMGDAGSLTVGFILAIVAVKVASTQPEVTTEWVYSSKLLVLFSFGILFFDTTRVIIIRFIKGKPIFLGDKNHIHHKLQQLGLSHQQTVMILGCINLLLIEASLSLLNTIPLSALAVIFAIMPLFIISITKYKPVTQ